MLKLCANSSLHGAVQARAFKDSILAFSFFSNFFFFLTFRKRKHFLISSVLPDDKKCSALGVAETRAGGCKACRGTQELQLGKAISGSMEDKLAGDFRGSATLSLLLLSGDFFG